MQRTNYRLMRIVTAWAIVLACASAGPAAAPKTQPKADKPAAKADKPKSPETRPAPRGSRSSTPRRSYRRRTRAPQPYSKNHLSTRSAFKPIAARANKSTVGVYCGGKQVALGAVVDAAGYVLTKASEVISTPQCRLRDGRKVSATIVAKDDRNDVVLLKVGAKGLTPIQWAGNDNPPVGSWIVTPGLQDVPVSIGVVSVAMRKGPSSRRPNRGFLGIGFASSGSEARIAQVIPKTGAARAGLRANDVITRINDRAIKDRAAMLRVLGRTKPNQKIKLRIKRGEKDLDVSATLGQYPAGGRISRQQFLGGDLSERRTGFEKIVQHDSTLQPSQCGGPALDADGKAVGINISRAGRVQSYILPASVVRPLIAKLKAAGTAKKRK